MARQPWVAQLRNARTAAEQIVVLRGLKNELVGHPLKKELAVTQGVLEPVVRLAFNKSGNRQDGKAHDHSFAARPMLEEELLRLQGLQVVGSIALGGPPFLAPLQATAALPAIISNLCPSSNPAQLVLASLRAICNLADSATLSSDIQALSIGTIADALFSRQNLNSIYRILSQSSPSSIVQSQVSIAAALISRVCREERHQQGLANSGVLDALATKLAGFVVAQGLVIPGAEHQAQRDGLQEYFPAAAPRNAKFTVILEAISTIITDSKFRASQLLYSPSILAVFPMSQPIEFSASQNARTAWNAFNAAGLSVRQSQLNAVDFLLPIIPLNQLKPSGTQVSAFPPLGTSNSSHNLTLSGRSAKNNGASVPWSDAANLDTSLALQDPANSEADEPESPLIAYLILLIKHRSGMERLMATSVLTVLYRAGLTNKTREIALGLLVVPILVQMLDDEMPKDDSFGDEEAVLLDWTIKERAPAILALLITDSEYLQKAAFDATVVSKLSKLLKVSYDPVPESASPRPWAPHESENVDPEDQAPHLGREGISPKLLHKIEVRESVLKAIAAVVAFKDEYRKAIVDQGMMPYIVSSMNLRPRKPSPKSRKKAEKPSTDTSDDEGKEGGYGTNSVKVLIAACGAARALSRSVSVLRTTLIDNGVAEPIFALLRHPDLEVQIAATAVVCNLVTDVSPMRQSFSDAGVLKVLCEHAHSMTAKLRLNSVWALKHFVQGVSNDMKRQCLDELGQGWLVQLICDDTEDEALLSSRGKERGSPSSSEPDEDTEMDQFEDQVDAAFNTNRLLSTTSRPTSRSKSILQAEARLAALRDDETNPARRARKDDIAVQEQGLDFIRNLIGGVGQAGVKDTTEMIDFLFSALGQDRVFDILASKLKPKLINPYTRASPSSERKILPPQAEIIIAVAYILVHMAASVPRHRQIVIAQTDLLKLLVPQFNNPSMEVRLALCWLVSNLTWMDDQNDGQACAHRAAELKKLGFLAKIEMLEQDPELNVRERAKSAMWQIKQTF